jgi:hypothetical protein
VLVQRGVVAVGFLELGGEVVDVCFEVSCPVPGCTDETVESVDLLGGFVAELDLVVFGDENLLAQGVDGYGGVVGCGCCCGWAWGCGWGGVAAFREVAAVFDVVWLLGVASAAGVRGSGSWDWARSSTSRSRETLMSSGVGVGSGSPVMVGVDVVDVLLFWTGRP